MALGYKGLGFLGFRVYGCRAWGGSDLKNWDVWIVLLHCSPYVDPVWQHMSTTIFQARVGGWLLLRMRVS